NGIEKVLFWFRGDYYNDGAHPAASLIEVNGKLYGTTYSGGFFENYGTVFQISLRGNEKVLHSFGIYSDGGNPLANLINVHGTLYGTTPYGGEGGSSEPFAWGTVFRITTTGTEQVLYAFNRSDGYYPAAGLIKVGGILYGTTEGGGAYGGSYGDGTAFSITTTGSLTTLHSFGSGSDGVSPWAALLNVRGTLYGTTGGGGAYGKGTIFRMSLSGKEKVLHSFGYGTDGATPLAGMIDVNGTLYGTTSAGGTYGNGTVFALTLPR
ncbi:MAG TPA: choice-of-anchor tandem repeat GloVer-containing protein, partial [Candidatus Cybelea sp.]